MIPAESPVGTVYCGHCGRPTAAGDGVDVIDHSLCDRRLAMEPPRYCVHCARRLKVQVTPTGWSAECSRHGRSFS